MAYGLRRYEAGQRLQWLVFFLLCIALAYGIARTHVLVAPHPLPLQTQWAQELKSTGFWLSLNGIRVDPLGRVLLFLGWVSIVFILGRLAWLIVQVIGKLMMRQVLGASLPKQTVHPTGHETLRFEVVFPTEVLRTRVNRLPFQLLFHSYRRLRLMLFNPQGTLSSEELVEKERRIVETDWQILWRSWTPLRWVLLALPFAGLLQSMWMLYLHFQPALAGTRELQDTIGSSLPGFIPLIQAVVITIAFHLGAALVKRLEEYYLSDVDSLLYDQFLSRLPFQSSDTVILLKTMQKQFQILQTSLKRIERILGVGMEQAELESAAKSREPSNRAKEP